MASQKKIFKEAIERKRKCLSDNQLQIQLSELSRSAVNTNSTPVQNGKTTDDGKVMENNEWLPKRASTPVKPKIIFNFKVLYRQSSLPCRPNVFNLILIGISIFLILRVDAQRQTYYQFPIKFQIRK